MNPFRRTGRYEKVPEQEAFLRELNRLVAPCDASFTKGLAAPSHPTVFIVGTPRCGSTFAAQFFPSALRLGYVSNLMARFYDAPSVGARLQAILLDPPTCGRMFRTDHGYTYEIESTHEFGYFWSKYLPFDETHQVDAADLAKVDTAALRRELAGMEAVFGAPVLFKNLICGLQIDFIAAAVPKAVFVDVARSRYHAAESVLKAREDSGADVADWWSLRPAEYAWLRDLGPFEQIAGQILFTRRRIEQQLALLPAGRAVRITYEQLCRQPAATAELLASALEAMGSPVQRREGVPESFDFRDENRPLPNKARFEQAFASVESRASDGG